MTPNEQKHIKAVERKIENVKILLNSASLSETTSMSEWLYCLRAMKEIVGNSHNDINTVACLMAKDYLCRKLPMRDYDAMGKAHGANGPDIDERTVDGQRVIAEIKTTGAFGYSDVRSPQKEAFLDDFQRLRITEAGHKFFFVVDPEIFGIVRRKYAAHIPGVTLVLVSTGEEFVTSR